MKDCCGRVALVVAGSPDPVTGSDRSSPGSAWRPSVRALDRSGDRPQHGGGGPVARPAHNTVLPGSGVRPLQTVGDGELCPQNPFVDGDFLPFGTVRDGDLIRFCRPVLACVTPPPSPPPTPSPCSPAPRGPSPPPRPSCFSTSIGRASRAGGFPFGPRRSAIHPGAATPGPDCQPHGEGPLAAQQSNCQTATLARISLRRGCRARTKREASARAASSLTLRN